MNFSFDAAFAMLVRVTGWGLGVYVIVTNKLDGAETVALILAFIGFEIVSSARARKLPELLDRKRENGG